jgi:phage-related minor tail protein
MANMGEISVDIMANTRQFQRSMERVQQTMTNVGNKMKDIGRKMTMSVTLPLVAAGVASLKLASDFEESMNKVDVAFKNNAQEVKDWSKTTLKSFGIAQGTALDMAALFGDMATGMGLPTDAASDMSKSLTGLAGDLSSFKNIRIDIAETALKSVFTGETESLKNLGIVMTQANLSQFAMSKGIKANIKDMSEAQKVQLRYAFVMEKTANAQGDFARTGGGAANQIRIFQESLKQLGQQLGQTILPFVTKVITKVNEWVQKFSELSPATKKIIVIVGAVVAAIGPLLIIVGTLITVLGAITVPMLVIAAKVGYSC